MKKLTISYFGNGVVTVDEIYGYSLDKVLSCVKDIEEVLSENELEENVICSTYQITNLQYCSPQIQIGDNYSPDVEIPGHWNFKMTFLRNETYK